jgi:hypothetical protein
VPLTAFHSSRALIFYFPLYYQTIALAVSEALLWHVSCDLPFQQNMSTVVLSAVFELF